jgi:sporulation protein YlmC with PRC-barrel domain
MVSGCAAGYGMGMSKRPITVRALFAFPLLLTLAWAVLGAAQTNPFFTPLKAGQMTGMKVEDIDGEKIGTVRNLVVDMRSGELKYAIIGSGGILGVHPTLRLAPSRIMSAATAKRATLAINVTADRWKGAPTFKSSSLATLAEPERAREIASYFNPMQVSTPEEASHPLATTGHASGEATNSPKLKLASDVLGMRVVNAKQEKIGEVLDLLVSFERPRTAYAIITTGRFLRHGRQYAVPLRNLSFTDEGSKLFLNATATAWQQAPTFDWRDWDSAATNGANAIFRYSKSED